jgi:hypothetical protein
MFVYPGLYYLINFFTFMLSMLLAPVSALLDRVETHMDDTERRKTIGF